MKSKSSALESPANKALKHYLDDLLSPKIDCITDTDGIQENQTSISRAQKLLQEASLLHDEFFDLTLDLRPGKPLDINVSEALPNPNRDAPNRDAPNRESGNKAGAKISHTLEKTVDLDKENDAAADIDTKGELHWCQDTLRDRLPTRFQVLLCGIAGVTIAIPLVELGSIQKLNKLSSIAGKPVWFKGVFVKGEQTYNCIDASEWLVPEKYKDKKVNECDYSFGVQLGKTPFLLCCNEVNRTIEVSKDDIEWREQPQKRLWLAGLVKKEMCALIDSETMVQEVLSH